MKIPWKLILIGAASLFVFLLVGSLTGANQKLFKMALDQIRTDKTRIVEVQAENQKWYEHEIKNLQDQLDKNKQAQIATQKESQRLKDELAKWQAQRENIVIPSDTNSLVDGFRSLGFRSVEYRDGRICFK